jgi:hypothetical protein
MPPPRTPASVPPPRSALSNARGFASGFGSGLKDIAKGTIDSARTVARGAYNIAVDPAARAQASQQARQAAQSASRYAQQAYNDPRKALNDGRRAVSGAYNNFEAARARAAAEGRSAEFYGRLSSEVAVAVVPGGALVKGARAAGSVATAGRAVSTGVRGARAAAATSARSVATAGARSTARAAPSRAATRAAARPLTPAATRARTAAANPSARAARSKVGVAPCPKAKSAATQRLVALRPPPIKKKQTSKLGTSATSNYSKTFFDANPKLKGQVVVHHAVEQQVLTKFPGVVTKSEINSLENLRGIPNSLNSDLHLSKIRVEWNRFYKPFLISGTQPTKAQLLQKATEIDTKFGNQFKPPLGDGL